MMTAKSFISSKVFTKFEIGMTRNYPQRRSILGVLSHTTAWDKHWGGDKVLD